MLLHEAKAPQARARAAKRPICEGVLTHREQRLAVRLVPRALGVERDRLGPSITSDKRGLRRGDGPREAAGNAGDSRSGNAQRGSARSGGGRNGESPDRRGAQRSMKTARSTDMKRAR